MEEKSLREQDTGAADFPIIHPQPICADPNATLQYRKEYNCQPQRLYNTGAARQFTVGGKVQSLLLDELKPGTLYRVSVRACVAELENGCGPALSIWFRMPENYQTTST